MLSVWSHGVTIFAPMYSPEWMARLADAQDTSANQGARKPRTVHLQSQFIPACATSTPGHSARNSKAWQEKDEHEGIDLGRDQS